MSQASWIDCSLCYCYFKLYQYLSSDFNCHEDVLSPISDAITHALRSGRPKPRYLVDGHGFDFSFFDDYNVSTISSMKSFRLTTRITLNLKHIAFTNTCLPLSNNTSDDDLYYRLLYPSSTVYRSCTLRMCGREPLHCLTYINMYMSDKS